MFAKLQSQALQQARDKHARIGSRHEAYAVILEELEEFWAHVRSQSLAVPSLLEELVHTAAMCQRAAEDLKMLPLLLQEEVPVKFPSAQDMLTKGWAPEVEQAGLPRKVAPMPSGNGYSVYYAGDQVRIVCAPDHGRWLTPAKFVIDRAIAEGRTKVVMADRMSRMLYWLPISELIATAELRGIDSEWSFERWSLAIERWNPMRWEDSDWERELPRPK